MDSSSRGNRRNLISKSKLVKSIYRAAKPSSAAQQPYTAKPLTEFAANQPIKPKPAPPSGFLIMNQDQAPTVAFVSVTDRNNRESYGTVESFYGAVREDEAVDAKAAKYISRVRESFRLERANSERKNTEDVR